MSEKAAQRIFSQFPDFSSDLMPRRAARRGFSYPFHECFVLQGRSTGFYTNFINPKIRHQKDVRNGHVGHVAPKITSKMEILVSFNQKHIKNGHLGRLARKIMSETETLAASRQNRKWPPLGGGKAFAVVSEHRTRSSNSRWPGRRRMS